MQKRNRKIGILIDNMHLEVMDGIRKAKELGADGFQVYCIQGLLAPENMSSTQRREFKQYVADQGLEISALCGDLGKGFLKPESNREILPRMKAIIDLAVDLDVRVVTSHIGRLPDDENDPVWAHGLEAFNDLGAYAEASGRIIAMETGPEEPITLKRFLDKIDNKGIGVNYDPANLAMGGFDHIGGVRVLKDYIVHTHAKDAVRLQTMATVGNDPYKRKNLEVPLGQGSVAFKYYLWMLDEIGYDGYLTIEREAGKNPVDEIGEAVRFLRELQAWDGLIYDRKEKQEVKLELPSLT